MPKTIQLRNVPVTLHRRLKTRAAQAGLSLNAYLISEIQRIAERPTMEELSERIKSHGSVQPRQSAASIIREMRGPLA